MAQTILTLNFAELFMKLAEWALFHVYHYSVGLFADVSLFVFMTLQYAQLGIMHMTNPGEFASEICYKGNTMERVQFIEHKGKKILHLNFAGCMPNEVLLVIKQARSTIRTQSSQSVFTLTDVTNAAFNSAVSDAMKEFVLHNKPYVVASAVVGVTGLKQIIFNAVMKLSGRKLTAFENLDEAKDWLASHS
jgi:hypothetical protein